MLQCNALAASWLRRAGHKSRGGPSSGSIWHRAAPPIGAAPSARGSRRGADPDWSPKPPRSPLPHVRWFSPPARGPIVRQVRLESPLVQRASPLVQRARSRARATGLASPLMQRARAIGKPAARAGKGNRKRKRGTRCWESNQARAITHKLAHRDLYPSGPRVEIGDRSRAAARRAGN